MSNSNPDNNRKLIEQLVNAIEIDNERNVFFFGKKYSIYREDGALPTSINMLVKTLEQLIYSRCYIKGRVSQEENSEPEETQNRSISRAREQQTFIKTLSEANQSAETWDKNWVIESMGRDGGVNVKKGNYLRTCYGGDFIRQSVHMGPAQPRERVNILVRRESQAVDEPFYFVFGEHITEEDPLYILRFYFNITAAGAAPLIKALSTQLNKFMIPFQFKVLNHSSYFERTDSAVLYINKRYAVICVEILALIYQELKSFFKPECPLFSLMIYPGLALAEDPAIGNESFGTTRARLISEGILHAFLDKTEHSQWTATVIRSIGEQQFSIRDFHLNPGSGFPKNYFCNGQTF